MQSALVMAWTGGILRRDMPPPLRHPLMFRPQFSVWGYQSYVPGKLGRGRCPRHYVQAYVGWLCR